MATKSEKKISFVLYEDNTPPRFYQINRGLIRFCLYGLPCLSLLCVLVVAAGGVYFEKLQRMAERKEPAIIKELKKEKAELVANNNLIQQERDLLEKKLSQGVDSSDGLGFLSLFKRSAGRVDKSSSPEMQLEEIEVVKLQDQINLNFKIINMTKDDSRLSGYLFVLMQVGNQLEVWPSGIFDNEAMQIAFGNGEFFATSRFRPVKAKFSPMVGSQALFKVIIFSRTGDLMFKQLISKPLN